MRLLPSRLLLANSDSYRRRARNRLNRPASRSKAVPIGSVGTPESQDIESSRHDRRISVLQRIAIWSHLEKGAAALSLGVITGLIVFGILHSAFFADQQAEARSFMSGDFANLQAGHRHSDYVSS